LLAAAREYSAKQNTEREAVDQERRASPRLHGAIARTIGIEIVSGRRPPGSGLAGEVEASEELGVSRSAYREALRILSAKGLIESWPRAGTRVTPRSRWNVLDPDVLAWSFESAPHPDFVRGLFELRELIEPGAAALAAARRTEDQLVLMRTALEDMARHPLETAKGQAADQRFHRTLLAAAGNEPLLALATTIGAAVRWSTRFKTRDGPLSRDPVPDHQRVYEAIAAGKPRGASEAMRSLIRSALKDMKMF
jgi:DNA-binding FadR family transcriptional regulator